MRLRESCTAALTQSRRSEVQCDVRARSTDSIQLRALESDPRMESVAFAKRLPNVD